MRAPKKLRGVLDLYEIDARKIDADLRTIIAMDKTMLAASCVTSTVAKLDNFLDENMSGDTLKPDGEWKQSVERMIRTW